MSPSSHLAARMTPSAQLRVSLLATVAVALMTIPGTGAAQKAGADSAMGSSAMGSSAMGSSAMGSSAMGSSDMAVGVAVGTKAPGAAVETLDGHAVDLSQYIGTKPVVIEFWATWCPLCKRLEPSLQAAQTKYGDRATFVSVGVSNNQTPAKEQAYVTANHLDGVFVFDRDGKAVAAYKAPHTSYLVVVNADGEVVYTGVGADQDVGAAIAKAFPMSHAMQPGGQ
jgi:thiol-disulfide isomerase/thioredoxin